MPFNDVPKYASDAEQVKGSVFDTWKDAGIRATAGDPMGGFGAIQGGGGRTLTKLAPEVEAGLLTAAKGGDANAMQTLYTQYMPLIKSLAGKSGAPRADLEQEAYFSLHNAVMTHDPSKGSFINSFIPRLRTDMTNQGIRQADSAVDVPLRQVKDRRTLSRVQGKRDVRSGGAPIQTRDPAGNLIPELSPEPANVYGEGSYTPFNDIARGRTGPTQLPTRRPGDITAQKMTPESASSASGLPVSRTRQLMNSPQEQGYLSWDQEGPLRDRIEKAASMSRYKDTPVEQGTSKLYKKGMGPGTTPMNMRRKP